MRFNLPTSYIVKTNIIIIIKKKKSKEFGWLEMAVLLSPFCALKTYQLFLTHFCFQNLKLFVYDLF